MKRNIFDIVNNIRKPSLEISRIDRLLNQQNGVYVGNELFTDFMDGTPISIIDYIDQYLFKSWCQRGTCINCDDFEISLNISYIPEDDEEVTQDFIIIYCEYAANMIYLIKQKILSKDTLTNVVSATEKNIEKFLDWYNYELKYFPKEEKVLVVPKNAYSTSVAENIENESLSYSIIEYNHHLLQGDIEKKKAILLALGSDLEPHRKEIKTINKNLEDSIFFMLNNLDLRHNNRKKGDKNYNEKVAKMKKSNLEKWYDELYQLILAAYILIDNKARMVEINNLKTEITT
ncbi:MAG: hypothetical protein J1G06_07400 [Oscillospiraceae bacterium]|nr:hypothetical protein [Oscillospiraceae bacterium]